MSARCFPFAGTLLLCFAVMIVPSASTAADGLTLYGAGSLREVMTDLAATFTREQGLEVATQFAASGRMRERIEAGETVDLFTSADLGHPRKLVAEGRATTMALFARNTLCALSPDRRGPIASTTIVERFLRPDIKVGVSPAKVDPLGDYTVELFERLGERGAGILPQLRARSVVLDNPPGAPPARSGDYVLDALQDGRVDLAIVYCSGRDRYGKLSSHVAVTDLPDDLQIGPQYGLALLKDAKPAAALLALAVLSPEGQAALARYGFKPVALPVDR